MIYYVGTYYLLINLITFFAMSIDKRRAIKNKWRISEVTFMILSFIGGFIGLYLGMKTFHHKTKKYYFYVWAIVGLVITIVFGNYYIKML